MVTTMTIEFSIVWTVFISAKFDNSCTSHKY